MEKKVHINNVEYLPASEIARALGYTPDYISKLAREKKILATQVGRRWYVNLDDALTFKESVDQDKKQRSVKIRNERKLEQKLRDPVYQPVSISSPLLAITQTALVVALGLTVGFGGFFVYEHDSQKAEVPSNNALERLAILVYDIFTIEVGDGDENTELFTEKPLQTSDIGEDFSIVHKTATTTFTTLIVAPEELFTETQVAEVRESFSDEVEISVDPENPDTGIITPVFRDRRGDDYRFLMMPVNKPAP